MRRNFSLGLSVNLYPYVLISMSLPTSMRSTILPRSPAFLDMRSGAHVSMPLNFPDFISSTILLNTGLCPVSLAECDSFFISVMSSFSLSARRSISLICESMESTCCSSDSVDFLAYRQYFIFTGTTILAGVPKGACIVLLFIHTGMTQTL